MHGIGNDFVMVNGFKYPLDEPKLHDLSRRMSDRRFGVGSDGLIIALPGKSEPFRMRMFNPDGSESEMCGNGIRCLAKFLIDEGLWRESLVGVETGAGDLALEIVGPDAVRVDMGTARLLRSEIPMAGPPDAHFIAEPIAAVGHEFLGTAVSMGNPHVVIQVEDIGAVPLEIWGPAIENHELFPNRTNVHFVQALGRSHIRQLTWERGAGRTLACGTGACACAVAGFLTGTSERIVTVTLPGGDLQIEYTDSGRVFMTGPCAKVFDGVWAD